MINQLFSPLSSQFPVDRRAGLGLTAVVSAVLAAFAAASIFTLTACNSGTGSATASGGDKLTAKIDGKPFEAVAISLSAQVNFGVPGAVLFLGNQTVDGVNRGITVTLYNVYGPGEYPLGTDISVFGGIGQTGEGTGSGGDANAWITKSNGASGKVLLKSIGEGRMTGTFEYTCEPGKNNVLSLDRTVTDGEFDLAYTGSFVPAAEGKGSRVSATLNGKPYHAASVYALLKDYTGKDGFQFSSTTSENGISIQLEGVTAPDSFGLANMPPIRTLIAGRNGGTAEFCCWQSATGNPGYIVVTSLSAKRVKGRFAGTIKPSAGKAATADLVVENGFFDVGLSP
ncbi:MAG: hypothetical protein ABIW76_02235 [Fibrobacteria bacterium]